MTKINILIQLLTVFILVSLINAFERKDLNEYDKNAAEYYEKYKEIYAKLLEERQKELSKNKEDSNKTRNLQEETTQKHNKCDHDKQDNDFYENYKSVFSNIIEKRGELEEDVRKLQQQQIAPIRITKDVTNIINTNFSDSQKEYLNLIIDISLLFIKNLLKVVPSNLNKPNLYQSTCYDIPVPENDINNGIRNSDLHIYFTVVSDEQAQYVANAAWCSFDKYQIRPNFGRVKLNLWFLRGYLGGTQSFQEDVSTIIHELFHILGFSTSLFEYWINPITQNFYGKSNVVVEEYIRGVKSKVLITKNIVETARKYYGCETMTGMQLENYGDEGIASHWERTLVGYETMAPSYSYAGNRLSVLTIALLKDTGYYAEVNENLAENLTWGKNKGCDFVYNACQSSTTFREFETRVSNACSFNYDAVGVMTPDISSQSCDYIQPTLGRVCEDDDDSSFSNYSNKHFYDKDSYYESYSYDSKCFESNLLNPNSGKTADLDQRCHKSACSEDQNTIYIFLPQIPDFKIECSIAESGKQKMIEYNNQYLGLITCPEDFQSFCQNKNCPKHCSKQGACIRGQCLCASGFGKEDCSLKCDKVVHNSQCIEKCPSGYYKNLDNTCRTTCPDGFYPDNDVCSPCDFQCGKCNGPSKNNCTACQFSTYLDGNTCVKTCPQGKQISESKKTCHSCSQGCEDCDNTTQVCITCKKGLIKNGSVCEEKKCDPSCLDCGTNPLECTKCNRGTFLNNSTKKCVKMEECPEQTYGHPAKNECKNCPVGCQSCVSEFQCTKCDEKNGYKQQRNSCVKCNKNCKTCQFDDPENCFTCESNFILYKSKCVSECPSGMFKHAQNFCVNCSTGCQQCISQDKCSVCDSKAGYKLSGDICVNSISDQCSSPCKTCSQSEPSTCASCIDNYYLQGTTCVQQCNSGFFADQQSKSCMSCSNGCLQCQSKDKCEVCDTQKGYKLFGDSCLTAVECVQPCKSCSPQMPTTCTSCADNYYLQGTTCVKQCDKGFFADKKTQTCQQCDKSCAQCENANQCTSCITNKVLHNQQCIDSCPKNYSNISGNCILVQDESAKENKENKENIASFGHTINFNLLLIFIITLLLI